MLQLILGKSGSGKTVLAENIIADLCKKGDKKLLMLVPDQSSFETESDFLELLGAGLSREVKVFGFTRLSNYVFKNTGNIPENVIDDGVRKIIMSRAIDEVKDKLDIFNSPKTKKSVLDLMIHSLKECKKDNISFDLLDSAAAKVENETLKKKLSETSLILNAYEALLEKTYVDPLENLNRLKDILLCERTFEGYTIVVDSFSGFTYQQLEIIRVLMAQSKDFYITLNIDINEKNSEIFATTSRTVKAIKRIARENGIEKKPDIILSEFKRTANKDISFLEKNIFRLNRESFSDKPENIEIYTASDIKNEVEYIARKIKSLIIDKGFKYRETAVICRDSSKYIGVLDVALEKYGIPYFMDIPRDIFTKPVIRFVCSALETVINNFDRDSLLSMLKTGLTPLSVDEISELENYIFVWDLDRSDLKKEFAENPNGFEAMTESDEKKLRKLEKLRQYIITPLVEFKLACKDADGLTISKELYKLCEYFEIEKAVDLLYDKLEAQGLLFEANEEVRAYNLMIESLEKLTAAVGESKLSLKKYKEYLDFKLGDIKLSDIPRYRDEVVVATADRVRLNDEKAVFVIGAVDGEFPSVPKTAGVFSENERRILIENNIPLTDSLEELSCHETYLAYCALTSTCDKLFVSTYASDFSGNIYEPSVIFTEIRRLFKSVNEFSFLNQNEEEELYCETQAFEYLAKSFLNASPRTNALKAYFESDSDYRPALDKLESTASKSAFKIADKSVSESLFGRNMMISASRIEKYNLCPFQYFCNYGLKAKERRKAEIDAIQFGNIVHFFLENFLIKNNKSVLNSLSDEDIKSDIDSILIEYAEENLGGLEDKSASFLTLFERLKINIFTLTKELIRGLMYSDFVPVDYELNIGGEIPAYRVDIDDERSVSVNGYIDRVDTLDKNENEKYIRVVDYKTGNKVFKLYEILYGINLQMLLYLKCVCENGEEYFKKKLIPSGVLYMPSAAKDIDGDKYTTDEKITSQLDSNFKMNGLILNDENVLNHMDRLGRFIKLSKKVEDGEYSDTLATSEQFKVIFKHIDDIVRSMGKELLDGKISASPIKGVADGCAYCPFDSVCLHTYEDDYRFKSEASPKQVYNNLKGDEDDG